MNGRNFIRTYLLIAFGFAWVVWGIDIIFLRESLFLFLIFTLVAMAGPALGTLVIYRMGWRPKKQVIHKSRKQAIVDGAVAILSLALILLVAQGAIPYVLRMMAGRPVTIYVEDLGRFFGMWLIVTVIWMPLTWLEEVGWRYFLFTELRKHSPRWATIGVGFIWALWHLPSCFATGGSQWAWAVALFYFISVPALHHVLAWSYIRGGSILFPTLMHAMVNAFGYAAYGVLGLAEYPANMDWTGFAILAGTNIAYFVLLSPFLFLLPRYMRHQTA